MRRRILLGFLALTSVGVVVLAVVEYRAKGIQGVADGVPDRQAAAGAERSPAPSFTIESLDGDTVDLESLRGNVVVINFWATWCTPCREEAPYFRQISGEFDDRGVRFLGINERDDRAAAQAFVREFELPYPSAFDPSGSLADDFALYAMPSTFLVDPDGFIRFRFTGYVSETDLRAAIDDLLGEAA